jgi:hypothetical protein
MIMIPQKRMSAIGSELALVTKKLTSAFGYQLT